jgi:DUF1365 family protein
MTNLYNMAGWITLLDGIQRIDSVCEKRGLSFEKHMKPEELEKYVHARKEDVLFSLRSIGAKQNLSDAQLAKKLTKLPVTTLVEIINEHAIHTK